MLPLSLKRYSLYVSWMKIVLPIGILFAVGLVIGWPYMRSLLNQEGLILFDISSPEIRENRMINPRYVSTDNKGQPYHVNAEWAKQRTDALADLTNPHGVLMMTEGQSFDIKAKSGLYNIQGKTLDLEGEVTLNSTDGYNAKTDKARVTLDGKIIDGPAYFEGQGPTGSMRGQKGFRVESCPEGKKFTLWGQSQVVIQKAALKKNKKAHAQ